MSLDNPSYQETLALAQRAMARGDRQAARRMALKTIQLGPDYEEGWLLLASLSSPRASLEYLQHALRINPSSERARQGLHWAIERLRSESKTPAVPIPSTPATPHRPITGPISSDALVSTRPALTPWFLLLLGVFLVFTAWLAIPQFNSIVGASAGLEFATFNFAKETLTPTFTPTATATYTPTASATATLPPPPTATVTNTPEPTATQTAEPTFTATPHSGKKNKKPKSPPVSYNYPGRPSGVDDNEAWIDIDLSSQRAYAYQGDALVNSFVVSTGTWQHPTVTGTYKIYVKYRYADMSGPGYYLPDVPYVMYFYKGYGLHGTYWHNNFGTPMSHGCVNFTIGEAGWVYNFTKVGSIVNVHK